MINLHSEIPLAAPRLADLVTAVLTADDQDEADWIEWKSTLDLTATAGHVHLSRAILGFANRDPQKCTQPCGGTAYVLAGVAPGKLQGIEPVDLEKLQPKLEKYLGSPGPFWRHFYVPPAENPDLRVLVIEVPPPRAGEYPYPWRTSYQPVTKSEKGADSGTLFTRRGSKTERANYEEVLMLVNRSAQAPAPRRLGDLSIEVGVLSLAGPLRTARVPDNEIEAWLERRRQILLAPVVEDAGRKLGLTRLLSDSDIREYSRNIDAYLEDCRARVEGVVIAEMMRDGINGIIIDVSNLSDDHLADVEVKVTLPDWCAVIDPSRTGRHVLPDPPPSPLLPSSFGRAQAATLSVRRQFNGDSIGPPKFAASPNLVRAGSNIYRESLGMIRAKAHSHTCTLSLLISHEVDELNAGIEITSTSFPGVIELAAQEPITTPDAALLDELVDPDPTKAAERRQPRFPPSHQH